jgi:hypothetical protein
VEADKALLRVTNGNWRGFQFGNDLFVCDDGDCEAVFDAYAGQRDDGSFPGDVPVCFTRFELWGL